MRDTTEQSEGIAAGMLKLVGTEETAIYPAFLDAEEYAKMSTVSNTHEDGFVCKRIADILRGTLDCVCRHSEVGIHGIGSCNGDSDGGYTFYMVYHV